MTRAIAGPKIILIIERTMRGSSFYEEEELLMAKRYEDFFRSEADGLEISALCICPEQKPYRAIIQLVHGMCEHKERYIPFMEYLAEKGYVTVIHDHRGHGKSVRTRDDLG